MYFLNSMLTIILLKISGYQADNSSRKLKDGIYIFPYFQQSNSSAYNTILKPLSL